MQDACNDYALQYSFFSKLNYRFQEENQTIQMCIVLQNVRGYVRMENNFNYANFIFVLLVKIQPFMVHKMRMFVYRRYVN